MSLRTPFNRHNGDAVGSVIDREMHEVASRKDAVYEVVCDQRHTSNDGDAFSRMFRRFSHDGLTSFVTFIGWTCLLPSSRTLCTPSFKHILHDREHPLWCPIGGERGGFRAYKPGKRSPRAFPRTLFASWSDFRMRISRSPRSTLFCLSLCYLIPILIISRSPPTPPIRVPRGLSDLATLLSLVRPT